MPGPATPPFGSRTEISIGGQGLLGENRLRGRFSGEVDHPDIKHERHCRLCMALIRLQFAVVEVTL